MDGDAFDLGKELNSRKVRYVLSPELWSEFTHGTIDIDFHRWTSMKYLNDVGDRLNPEVDNIPGDMGGIYLFYVSASIIPCMTEFPFYIGRAQLTEGQNLRKRIKEYFQHYDRDDERPKIFRMLRTWGKQLRVAYCVVEGNANTIELEKSLINSLLLPMNDIIPNKIIREAIKAFES